jgi:hypothetical protein
MSLHENILFYLFLAFQEKSQVRTIISPQAAVSPMSSTVVGAAVSPMSSTVVGAAVSPMSSTVVGVAVSPMSSTVVGAAVSPMSSTVVGDTFIAEVGALLINISIFLLLTHRRLLPN